MKTRLTLLIWAGAFAVVVTALAAFALTPAAFAERPDAPSFTCTWTGTTSSDWNNLANWNGCVPNGGGDDAVIPAGSVPNEPTLASNATVRSLTVGVGRTLTLSNTRRLSFNQGFSNAGLITGTGTLVANGTQSLTQSGTVNASLEIAVGTATAASATYSGTLLVDAGASFVTACTIAITVVGDVTINGALANTCSNDTFVFKGASFTNNGAVSLANVTFSRAGNQTISGPGTWTGANLTISPASTTGTANPLTIAAGALVVSAGGTLSVTNPLTFTGGTLSNSGSVAVGATLLLTGSITFNNFGTGSVGGGGTLQTRGAISLFQGGAFNAPIEVASGLTTGSSSGVYSGTLLVDAGASFVTACTIMITAVGDVTINGALANTCSNDTFVFKGASFTNNGAVSLANVIFSRAGNQTISGPGTWTGANLTISPASTTSLGSDIVLAVSNFTVNGAYSGGAFTTAFDGATTLGGSGTIGFHGIAFNTSHSLFASGKNFSVSGDWTNTGSFSAGNNTVAFDGTASPAGLQTYAGSSTFSGLDITSGAVVETGNSFMNVSGSLNENGQARHSSNVAQPCGGSEMDAFNRATLTLNNCAGGISNALVKSAAGGLFPDTTLGANPAYGTCSPSPQLTHRYWQIAPNGAGTADVTFAYNPVELTGTTNKLGVYRCLNGLWVLQAGSTAYGVNGSGYNVVTATALALGGAYALGDAADLSVSKSASANPAIVGDVLTYTVVISNNGTFTATAVSITDVLPANVMLLGTGASQGACGGSGPINCGLNDIASGGSVTVTVAVRPLLAGIITNTVSAASNPADLNFANNSALVAVVITPSVMISVADTSATTGIVVPSPALFSVTLSAASGAPITVTYATADGSAVSGTDYTSTSGTLVFAPGATTAVISVTLAARPFPAAPKTFVLNLTGAINGTIARSQATCTLSNSTRQLFLPLIKR